MTQPTLSQLIELSQFPEPKTLEQTEQNKFYQTAFTKIAAGQVFTWNWSAFLFFYFWMLYRKMYLFSFILLMIDLLGLVNLFSTVYGPELPHLTTVMTLISWTIRFGVIPALSNYLYYRHLSYQLRKGYNLIHERPTLPLWLTILFPFTLLWGLYSWRAALKKIKDLKCQTADSKDL